MKLSLKHATSSFMSVLDTPCAVLIGTKASQYGPINQGQAEP